MSYEESICISSSCRPFVSCSGIGLNVSDELLQSFKLCVSATSILLCYDVDGSNELSQLFKLSVIVLQRLASNQFYRIGTSNQYCVRRQCSCQELVYSKTCNLSQDSV